MNRRYLLILPDAGDLPSGGHLYNRHIVKALREVGASVVVCEWETMPPADWAAALADPQQHIWVDSLYLNQLRTINLAESRNARLGLLVHHLESLHPPVGWTGPGWFGKHERAVLEKLDAFWCTSQFTQAYLQGKQLGEQCYLVVPPALPSIPRTKIRPVAPLQAILVANWVERKGVLPFLQAVAAQQAPEDNFCLYLAGSDAIEPDYAAQCREFLAVNPRLANCVKGLGAISQAELWQRYPKMHLLISAAKMETYGMALQEGAAFGLPILAQRGGYIATHVQEGQTGYLFDSYPEMATRFLSFVRQPSRLQVLVDACAQARPAQPTWEQAARRVVEGA